MADKPVSCAVDHGIATITIEREKRRNTLDLATLEGLQQYLAEMAKDTTVRVVVITGQGDKAFCAGADLSLISSWPQIAAEGGNPYTDLLHTLLRFPKPLVARVNGHALGGGIGVLLACDVALAAEDVKLGTPEVHIGLFPFMVLPLLSRHVGPKKAADLALTGRKVPAPEAVNLGLINRAVPRDKLDAEVALIGQALAAGGPMAQMLGKEAVSDVLDQELHDRIDRMAKFFTRGLQSQEFAEGVTAFMEGRPPAWTQEEE